MKLSSDTLAILKNFSDINGQLLISEGNTLQTMAVSKDILSSATIAETFNTPFAFYSLKEFLNALSIFDDPELEFTEQYVTIKDSKDPSIRTKYYTAQTSIMKVPEINVFDTFGIDFVLKELNLQRIMKAGDILTSDDIKFEGKDGVLKAIVYRSDNSSNNTFTVVLDDNYQGTDFSATVTKSKLKTMLMGSYRCEIIGKGERFVAIKCVNEDKPLEYFLTLSID